MTIHNIARNTKIDGNVLGIKDGDILDLEPGQWDTGLIVSNLPGTVTIQGKGVVLADDKWTRFTDCENIVIRGLGDVPQTSIVFKHRIQNVGKLASISFYNVAMITKELLPGINIKPRGTEVDMAIDFILIEGCYIHGPKYGGESLYLGHKDNRIGAVTIQGNRLGGWGEGPQVRYTDDVIIRDNYIEDVYPTPHKIERKKTQGPQEGEVVYGYSPHVAAISIGDGNGNVWIEDNTIANCGGRFLHYTSGNGVIAGNDVTGIGLEHEKYKEAIRILFEKRKVIIRDNTFEKVKGHILWVSSDIGENVYFQSNTIIEPDGNKELHDLGGMPESNLVGNVQFFERPVLESPPVEAEPVADMQEFGRRITALEQQIATLKQSVDDLTTGYRWIVDELGENGESNGVDTSEVLRGIRDIISDALPDGEPTPTPEPNPESFVLWSADHSTGDISQWEHRQGQAVYNSHTEPGTSEVAISSDFAHSGQYSLKLSLTGAENGQKQGARIFRRWLDADNQMPLPDEAYYSAWYYIPQKYEIPNWWNIFQFKSRGDSSQAMFSFNVDNDDDGNMFLYVWDKANGKAHRQAEPITFPVAKWFHLEAFVKARSTQSGQLVIWQDGIKIIDAANIYTLRGEGDRLHWSVNNYTDDIVPSDPVIYVDDCAISLERVGV